MNQKIFFEDLGNPNGQPIIFIPGWGSTLTDLKEYTLKYYENKFRCIYIDCLGYGMSDKYILKDKKYICEQNADAINELIAELNLENVILVGHCIGGWIGSLIAYNNPEKISAIIFMDGYLYFDKEYLPFIMPLIRFPFYKFFFQTRTGIELSNRMVKFNTFISDEYVAKQKLKNAKVALDYIRDLYLMERQGKKVLIKGLKCESLFIIGEYSMSVIKRSQKYWDENVFGSKIDVVSKSAHDAISENPIELHQKIIEFIEKI